MNSAAQPPRPATPTPLDQAVLIVAGGYHATTGPHPPDQRHPAMVDAAAALAELIPKTPADIRPALRYHEAWFLAVTRGADQAVLQVKDLIQPPAPAPESLWLAIQLTGAGADAASAQRRWALEDRLGALLPISPWGRLRDARLEEKAAEKAGHPPVDVPRLVIPDVRPEFLFEIARTFEAMQMDALAASAYREAIYGAMPPPQFPDPGPESWISPEAAGAWLAVAELDARSGRRAWAAQAALLAAAGAPERVAGAQEVLRSLWPPQAGPQPLEPRRAEPDAQALRRIADLYRQSNLHPRAIQALDIAARHAGGDVAAERAQTLEQWQSLLTRYARLAPEHAYLFGQPVARTPPAQLAPPAFQYSAR